MSNPYPEYKRNTITVPLAEQPTPATELREQEPVGYVAENGIVDWNVCAPPIMTGLYTSPPTLSLAQRQSRSDVKPLTDEEIWKDDAIMSANSGYGANFETLRELILAIEAAHGIKENT